MSLSTNSRLLSRFSRQIQVISPFRGLASLPSKNPDQAFASTSGKSTVESSTDEAAVLNEQETVKGWADRLDSISSKARFPRSVQAVYLRPLRRKAEWGLPACDLQLRSYSIRNVEFFADFAVRAAYYLNLPVSGPIPLPRIVERWTFPRSNFVHKKTQENFERVTLRRLIQVKDGDSQVVQAWLAFLRKHAFYGVGMKANVWEHESLDIAKNMDQALGEVEKSLKPHLSQFGKRKDKEQSSSLSDILHYGGLTQSKGPLVDVRKT